MTWLADSDRELIMEMGAPESAFVPLGNGRWVLNEDVLLDLGWHRQEGGGLVAPGVIYTVVMPPVGPVPTTAVFVRLNDDGTTELLGVEVSDERGVVGRAGVIPPRPG